MAISAVTSATGSHLLRRAPLVGLVLAIGSLLLLALAPLGWRAGWWHYRTSFFTLMAYSGYVGLGAAVVSALSLLLGRGAIGRLGTIVAVLGLAAGAVLAYVPWHYNNLRYAVPPIHDISTDTEDPPAFVAVLPARTAEGANPVAYEGAKVAEAQRKAYPDIAPLTLALPPAEAFKRALDAARQQGWTIIASDPEKGRIEASQTSFWFGFTDDVVVRVTAQESGSRVDVRSLSRQGRSDFGVNAARIRAYMDRLSKSAAV